MTRVVTEWSVDDVVIWLKCLGFAEKSGPFQEEEIAGDIILTLTGEELSEDLGLTKLQAKRAVRSIAFMKFLAESGIDKIEDNEKKVEDLRINYEGLKRQYYDKNDKIEYYETKIVKLKKEAEAKAKAEAPPIVEAKPAPPVVEAKATPQAPPPHHQQQQHHGRRHGPGVIGGAAGGAAGGALKGAIAGAILPGMDASDGAKAGAAVGALGGAGRGFRNRRRR